jgi:hypothetical protein
VAIAPYTRPDGSGARDGSEKPRRILRRLADVRTGQVGILPLKSAVILQRAAVTVHARCVRVTKLRWKWRQPRGSDRDLAIMVF